jgi:hypothetical protein
MPPDLFAWVILELASLFLARMAWNATGMTGMCHYTQLFSIEMGSQTIFLQAGLELLSSPSQPPAQLGVSDACH